MIKKYLRVWLLFTINSFQTQLNVRWGLLLFLIAKILRFSIYVLFIIILLNNTKLLAGYTLDQTLLFFLTFNLVDMLSQLVFRDVYRFRGQIISGNFDFYLLKPVSPLFRSLFGGPDLLDFATLIPLIFAIIFFINKLGLLTLFGITGYLGMVLIGFSIALSFHILVLALAVVTTEIDNAIMLYRDIMAMGRMPVDIYREPIRGILTFIIPVGIMMSFPVKSLLGLLSPQLFLYSTFFAAVFFYLSLRAWKYSLKKYSSASS